MRGLAIHDDPSEPTSPGPVAETAIGLGPGVAGADVLVVDDGAGPSSNSHLRWWRPSRRLMAGALAAVVTVMALIALRGPSGLPTAQLAGIEAFDLPEAPTTAVRHRWSTHLGRGDGVALVDDRVVVVAHGSDDRVTVTARHVRSRQVLWERPLVGPTQVLVVDDGGHAVLPQGPRLDDGSDEDRRTVAIDGATGTILWERPRRSLMAHPSKAYILERTETTCTVFDTRSGVTTWEEPAANCFWLDGDTAALLVDDGWELRTLDGTVRGSLPPSVGQGAPQPIGDLYVVALPDRVAAFDHGGSPRWSAPMSLSDPRLQVVGDLAVVTSGDGTRVWDLEGRPVDLGVSRLEYWIGVEVDGRMLAVVSDYHNQFVDLAVRDLADPGEDLGRTRSQWVRSQLTPLTAQGLLVVDTSDDPALSLRSWPRLDLVWTADVDVTFDPDGAAVQSSSWGLVLAPWREGDRRWTIHVYA